MDRQTDRQTDSMLQEKKLYDIFNIYFLLQIERWMDRSTDRYYGQADSIVWQKYLNDMPNIYSITDRQMDKQIDRQTNSISCMKEIVA